MIYELLPSAVVLLGSDRDQEQKKRRRKKQLVIVRTRQEEKKDGLQTERVNVLSCDCHFHLTTTN